jgi:hypothetical protein
LSARYTPSLSGLHSKRMNGILPQRESSSLRAAGKEPSCLQEYDASQRWSVALEHPTTSRASPQPRRQQRTVQWKPIDQTSNLSLLAWAIQTNRQLICPLCLPLFDIWLQFVNVSSQNWGMVPVIK